MITRRFLILAAGATALADAAFAKKGDAQLPPSLADLNSLPLVRTDGTPTTLGAEIGIGRAALVSLWAAWCAPCLAEAKHLSELRTKHPEDRLAILGINVDQRRTDEKDAVFLKKGKVNYVQFRSDPAPVYLAFGNQLPITLPRLYVFTRSGTPTAVFGAYSGKKTLKAVDKAVEAALNAA